MSIESIEKLLKLREAKADRAQMEFAKCNNELDVAKSGVVAANKVLGEYVNERPEIEKDLFKEFENSECDSVSIADYRHCMGKVSAQQGKLEQEYNDAVEKKEKSEAAVEASLDVLNEINKKVEKLTIIEANLIAIRKNDAERLEDNELDEQANLASAK